MRVRVLIDRSCACFSNGGVAAEAAKERIAVGDVVGAEPATNLSDCEAKGLLWVDTQPHCYGILLAADDYEVVEGGKDASTK